MFKKIVASGALTFAITVQADEATCRPNYEVAHAACHNTGEVLSVSRYVLPGVVVNHGACEVPDKQALCRDHIQDIERDIEGAHNITFFNSRLKNLPLKGCLSGWQPRTKVDVLCDFVFDAPTFKYVATEECPVTEIRETNACFGNHLVHLDPEAITQCLNLRPKSDGQWWIKATCLKDLKRASDQFALVLDHDTLALVQDQFLRTGDVLAEAGSFEPLLSAVRK